MTTSAPQRGAALPRGSVKIVLGRTGLTFSDSQALLAFYKAFLIHLVGGSASRGGVSKLCLAARG